MAALREPVKIFIVQSLACFETPQQVADAVKENFNIEIGRQQVAFYDPTKVAGKNLSKKFVTLFNETRKKFQENVLDIPIANKAFRLKEMQKMFDDFGRNRIMKLNVLKQAFQETDGRITRQEHTGKDGGALQNENTTYVTASKELVRQVMDELESKY